MKTNNLFPLAEPNHKFRQQLKFEVLEVCSQQRRLLFNWRWLVTPSVVLAFLLLVVLIDNGQPFSQLSSIGQPRQPGITQSNISDQNSGQLQQNKDSQLTKQVEISQNLDQLDNELTQVSDILNTDLDLEAAIAFNNL